MNFHSLVKYINLEVELCIAKIELLKELYINRDWVF